MSSPALLAASQGLAVSRLATSEPDDDRRPAARMTIASVLMRGAVLAVAGAGRMRARRRGTFCGMKSSGAPGTL